MRCDKPTNALSQQGNLKAVHILEQSWYLPFPFSIRPVQFLLQHGEGHFFITYV